MNRISLDFYKHCRMGMNNYGILTESLQPEITDWLESYNIKYTFIMEKVPNLMYNGRVMTYHLLPSIDIEDAIYAIEFKLTWI